MEARQYRWRVPGIAACSILLSGAVCGAPAAAGSAAGAGLRAGTFAAMPGTAVAAMPAVTHAAVPAAAVAAMPGAAAAMPALMVAAIPAAAVAAMHAAAVAAMPGALFLADSGNDPLGPTLAGTFEGTWFYVDPGFQIALFVSHDKTGLLRIRYGVRSKNGGSGYQTDDGGYAKYIDDRGTLVEVLFTGSPVTEEKIAGFHQRLVHAKDVRVEESGEFEMYRTEKGRKLVLRYPVYKIETTDSAGRVSTTSESNTVRLFRKASDMIVDFDEIPF